MDIKEYRQNLPRAFGHADTAFGGAEFSEGLVDVLKTLHEAFPDCIDLSDHACAAELRDDLPKLWNWLGTQGIVCGETTNCALTLSGHQAFGAALDEHPRLATLLAQPNTRLQASDASRLLISVLRIHYLRYGQRVEDNKD